MKPELADREPIAFHELGHLAAFRYFGYKVDMVEVGDDYGCTQLATPQTIEALHYIIALCSGKAAVDRWYGWKTPTDDNWLKSQDQRRAFRAALQLSSNDPVCARMLMKWAEKRADILIADQWQRIKDTALTLLERGKLGSGMT